MNRFMLTLVVVLGLASPAWAVSEPKPVLFHVKTALSVDDAQICVVPNVAWGALAKGRTVTIIIDGSAVTSIARGYGWRGWVSLSSTALERAGLPQREREALAKQFNVALKDVPVDYNAYFTLQRDNGVAV